jgi:hypothetical protein
MRFSSCEGGDSSPSIGDTSTNSRVDSSAETSLGFGSSSVVVARWSLGPVMSVGASRARWSSVLGTRASVILGLMRLSRCVPRGRGFRAAPSRGELLGDLLVGVSCPGRLLLVTVDQVGGTVVISRDSSFGSLDMRTWLG